MSKRFIWLSPILALGVTMGCNLAPRPSPVLDTITTFDAAVVEDTNSEDLCYTYTGTNSLEDVRVKITVYYQDSIQNLEERFFGTWQPKETKKVSVRKTSSIEKHEMAATGTLNGQPIRCSATYRRKAASQ
jgi:hypothetical protein